MCVCVCLRYRHRAAVRRGIQQQTGAAAVRDEEKDGGLLGRGESPDGDAGRRAGGGEEEGAGETSEEGEGATAGKEAQGGLHAVRR